MNREYSDYIEDILAAVEKAELFIKDMSYDSFKDDDKTVFAVIRAIEVIGKATKHIPDEVRQNYSDIPWKEMAGRCPHT
jgi:uncharacterized protein with HEPN domain